MVDAQVLVLHGSPGSGKTTMARAVAEVLREADVAVAVIDLDDLSTIHPYPSRMFPIDNLRAIWPNYVAAAPGLKLIVPTVFADENEVELLRDALPGTTLTVCELTAPEAVLKERVTAREPNEFWRQRLRELVDLYGSRTDLDRIVDIEVTTYGRTEADTADEIIDKVGWR